MAPLSPRLPIAAPALSQPLRAALLMLTAVSAFSVMAALIRVASESMHPLQIVFFRIFFALLLLSPVLIRDGGALWRSPVLGLHIVRALIGLCAMTAFFVSLTLAPLAEVTTLGFAMPLFATLGAVLILKEQIRWRRIIALGAGFCGIMIVLGPQIGAPSVGAAAALSAAALIGVSVIMVKILTRTDSPPLIAASMVLMQAPLALIPALFVWRTPDLTTLALLIAIGAAATAGHLCWTRASSLADVSQIQPFEFAKLPIAAAIGFFAFAETPAPTIWIGGAVIFAATTYITWRETQVARSVRAAAAGGPSAVVDGGGYRARPSAPSADKEPPKAEP